jgi:hypothetical protein
VRGRLRLGRRQRSTVMPSIVGAARRDRANALNIVFMEVARSSRAMTTEGWAMTTEGWAMTTEGWAMTTEGSWDRRWRQWCAGA